MSSFLAAVEHGEVARVRELLRVLQSSTSRKNIPGAIRAHDKHYGLRVACSRGQAEIVQLLLEHFRLLGYSATQWRDIQPRGSSYLIEACRAGNPAVVRLLLDDLNACPAKIRIEALFEACTANYPPAIWTMLAGDQLVVQNLTSKPNTQRVMGPQHTFISVNVFGHACLVGHNGIVQALMAHKDLSPNMPAGEHGCTGLHLACCGGHLDVVETLLRDPATDINQRMTTLSAYCALQLACKNGHHAIVQRLLGDPRLQVHQHHQHQSIFTTPPLREACQHGHSAIVRTLLGDPRIDPNEQVEFMRTVLHTACSRGQVEMVEILLGHPRLDLTLEDRSGMTAFQHACNLGHLEIVVLMLADHRLNPNRLSKNRKSPLLLACEAQCPPVVKALLQDPRVEVNLPCRSTKDSTPIWASATAGQLEITKMLLASRYRIDTSKPVQATWGVNKVEALDAAKDNGHLEVAELLGKFREDPAGTRQRLCIELGSLHFTFPHIGLIPCLTPLFTLHPPPHQAGSLLAARSLP